MIIKCYKINNPWKLSCPKGSFFGKSCEHMYFHSEWPPPFFFGTADNGPWWACYTRNIFIHSLYPETCPIAVPELWYFHRNPKDSQTRRNWLFLNWKMWCPFHELWFMGKLSCNSHSQECNFYLGWSQRLVWGIIFWNLTFPIEQKI